jgi:membrane protein implicated in regulation of membrane protease activity
VKLPAVVTGGSVATATGLLVPHLPPLAAGAMVLADLTAFAWYVWSVTKRQQQAQRGALELVRELRDARVSVVVRADGQVEIQPVTGDATPPESEPLPRGEPPPAA